MPWDIEYWVKIIAWFVYFYSIDKYLFNLPISLFKLHSYRYTHPIPPSTVPHHWLPFISPGRVGTTWVSPNYGMSSLCRVRHILSHWGQTKQPSYGKNLHRQEQLKGHALLWMLETPWRLSSISTTYMVGASIPACVCSLVGGSISESLLGSGLVDSEGLLIDFLFLQRPSILSPTLLKYSLSPVQYRLWVSAYVSVRCWMETLRGQWC